MTTEEGSLVQLMKGVCWSLLGRSGQWFHQNNHDMTADPTMNWLLTRRTPHSSLKSVELNPWSCLNARVHLEQVCLAGTLSMQILGHRQRLL